MINNATSYVATGLGTSLLVAGGILGCQKGLELLLATGATVGVKYTDHHMKNSEKNKWFHKQSDGFSDLLKQNLIRDLTSSVIMIATGTLLYFSASQSTEIDKSSTYNEFNNATMCSFQERIANLYTEKLSQPMSFINKFDNATMCSFQERIANLYTEKLSQPMSFINKFDNVTMCSFQERITGSFNGDMCETIKNLTSFDSIFRKDSMVLDENLEFLKERFQNVPASAVKLATNFFNKFFT